MISIRIRPGLMIGGVVLLVAGVLHAAPLLAPRKLTILQDPSINESSGLARSIRRPGCFWTHNDSGDKPRLFMIDSDGRTLAVVTVRGADAVDWEDMASCEIGGKAFLFVADVGNNKRNRESVCLYEIPEPEIARKDSVQQIAVDASRKLQFRFEDGPKNCESLAVDAGSGVILLVSKETRQSVAYQLRMDDFGKAEVQTARKIATIPFSTATGMDVSPDGRQLVLCSYIGGCLFKRSDQEHWADVLKRAPLPIGLPIRVTGEAVCFGADGCLYFTSEGERQPLWMVPVGETQRGALKP